MPPGKNTNRRCAVEPYRGNDETISKPQVLAVAQSRQYIDAVVDDANSLLSITEVETGSEALGRLAEYPADCILCTDELPEMETLEFLRKVEETDPFVPTVLVAIDGSEHLASKAITAGVREYVPVDHDQKIDELEELIVRSVKETFQCVRRDTLDGIEAAVEHAGDAILITDTDGVIEYVNPAFEEVTGYNRRQALGRNPRIIKSGEQDEQYYESMWSAILDGEVWEETIVNKTRSGEHYVAHQTVAPVTNEDGEIQHFVGIQRDVTKQNRLEEQLKRSERTLSQLYEVTTEESLDIEEKVEAALTIGTRHLDFPVGYFTRIDEGTQEVLAATGNHDKITEGATDPLERTYCRKTIDAENPVVVADAEEEGWDNDPAYEHFGLGCYLGGRVVVNGETFGTLCFAGEEPKEQLLLDAQQSTIQALANWVGYELEREQHAIKLERQNERLEKFASAVSHDLRNPLNIAQAYAELSKEDENLDQLDRVIEAHERMETIIEDALTLARKGELVESTEKISLRDVSERSWRSVETGDATLEIEEDISLYADGDKLQHIFENLFRNSVEHGSASESQNGSEQLTVRVGPTGSGFYIEDNGSGIPEDERDQIFEYGYSTGGGSGFGLSIVETIVRAHGWTVRVTDSDEGGARFVVDTEATSDKSLVY